MKRVGVILAVVIGLVVPASAFNLLLGIGGGSGGGGVPDAHQMVLITPFNTATLQYLNCFTSSNSVSDFYGNGGTIYPIAENFFSGSPDADAQFCVIRVGQSGSRARVIGAEMSHGSGSPTSPNILSALNAITSGTLNFTQDGTSVSVSGINLSGDASLSAVATTISTAIQSAQGTDATLLLSSIATASCTGWTGVLGAGFLNITAVTTNCIVPGGVLPTSPGAPATPGLIEAQQSGTPGGVGVYAVSSPISVASGAFVPTVYAGGAGVEDYLILTVGTATGTIASGQGIYTTGGLDAGVYGLTSAPWATASLTGGAAAGSTWVIGDATQSAVSSTTMTTSLCRLNVEDTTYTGNDYNSDRMWLEQHAYCTQTLPGHTITYATSGADNLAQILGWASNSTGVPGNTTAYSGPYLEATNEVLGDPNSSYASTWETWLAEAFASVPGMTSHAVDQIQWDPDDGQQTPTLKNGVSTWFATNEPAFQYARVFSSTAYPESSYAGNSPYGLPVCVSGSQVFPVTGTWTLDYCPVHDYYFIGGAGASSNGGNPGTGAGTGSGGVGASGALTYLTGLTTNSGNVAASPQVGVAGGGNNAGNTTEIPSWGLMYSGGVYALSGPSSSGVTSGTAPSQPCTYGTTFVLKAGTYATLGCASGATGPTHNTGGMGGSGGGAAASLTHAGYVGANASASGGNGGAGTAANGGSASTSTGGAGGLNSDGTTGGAGGTTGNNGTVPGGGGGGAPTGDSANNGAAGHNGTDFTTLTHPCSSGGPGGGGGGGGAADAGGGPPYPVSSNGGNGGNYGGAAGSGAGTSNANGTTGLAGTSAGGLICIVGYQDH
jgi:hypothetical protein